MADLVERLEAGETGLETLAYARSIWRMNSHAQSSAGNYY